MTKPAAELTPPPADLADALGRIRSHGGRMTNAKRAMAALLFDSPEPHTADGFVDHLVDHDHSVVYRCLAQFEELGIAEHVHLGHGQAVYRRRGLSTVPVGCTICGSSVDIDLAEAEAFTRRIKALTGISLDLAHFALSGRCARCEAGSADGSSVGAGSHE
jgi:Fur family transcriptional regulator, ferric uptake regulator